MNLQVHGVACSRSLERDIDPMVCEQRRGDRLGPLGSRLEGGIVAGDIGQVARGLEVGRDLVDQPRVGAVERVTSREVVGIAVTARGPILLVISRLALDPRTGGDEPVARGQSG